MIFTEVFSKYRAKIYFIIYYLMVSLTFGYLYYQKLIVHADFYSYDSSCAIYPVINFTALKVLQYRMLVPFTFALFKGVFPFISDYGIYFMLAIIQTFIIIVIFYRLLNLFFDDKRKNALMAPVITYPMVWNYTILNGQNFFVDFSLLIFILLGYYFIIKENNRLLLLTLLIGCVNHDSIGFLIPMYLLYNYKKVFTKKVILQSVIMIVIYTGVKYILSEVFINSPGLSFRLNHVRNFNYTFEMPVHLIIRNVLLIFGGIHLLLLPAIKNPVWKKLPPGRLAINFTIIPYFVVLFFIHSIDEIRNYIAAIPFIIIPFLIYLSGLNRSLLTLRDFGTSSSAVRQ